MKNVLSKTMLLCAALLLTAGVLYAAPLNRNQAREKALAFLQGSAKTPQIQAEDLVCVYPADATDATDAAGNVSDNQAKGDVISPLYAFNLSTVDNNTRGFVIIAGESDFGSVIGYSFQHAFPAADDMPANLLDYLQWHETRIEAYQQAVAAGTLPVPVPGSTAKRQPKADAEPVVAPLLENHPDGSILFNQRWPYNALCPDPNNYGFSMVTGCVATALAQIARYYEYPEHGQDSITYYTGGMELSVNFSQSYYDWENMLTDYNTQPDSGFTAEEVHAVALLHKDIGYAVQMMYGYNGSGAYDMNAMTGMVKYMNYSKAVRYESRSTYNEEDWRGLLAAELDAGQPMYHSGYGSGGGHAFVCDGYNEENYFHFNWGWAGAGNGWYSLEDLAPTELGTGAGYGVFNDGRTVFLNLRPPRDDDEKWAEIMYSRSDRTKALDCKRGVHSASDTLVCTAFDFYNYTADTIFVEMGIAYWQDGKLVAVDEFDYEKAWNEGWDPGNGEHPEYEGPGEPLPPFYGYNRMDFEVTPGQHLPEGTYTIALAARYNHHDEWRKVRAPSDLLSTYKLVIRNDSVLVFLVDEEGNIPEPEFPDVINLRYKVIGTMAIVAWDVDSTMRVLPLQFRIYVDGKYKGLVRKTEYTMYNLEAGEHTVRIIAIYGYTGQDAEGVSISFTVEETANEKVEPLGGLCRVWPNPVTSVLYVETLEPGTLRLVSLDGKTVYEKRVEAGANQRIGTDHLAAGLYVLRFESLSGRVAAGKIIRK